MKIEKEWKVTSYCCDDMEFALASKLFKLAPMNVILVDKNGGIWGIVVCPFCGKQIQWIDDGSQTQEAKDEKTP